MRAAKVFRPPYLRAIRFDRERMAAGGYPFGLPAWRGLDAIDFSTPVTFLVGENGSGKSTLLEAIAAHAGIAVRGGSRNQATADDWDHAPLASAMKIAWAPRITDGFFLRAETVFDFATYLDQLDGDALGPYGGRSLHTRSHGEAFFAFFSHRLAGMERTLLLFDEPEAALSPQRQLAFLKFAHDLELQGCQLIIATHAPILLAYPGATLLSLDASPMAPIAFTDTEHYRVTKGFLDRPDVWLRRLFAEGDP